MSLAPPPPQPKFEVELPAGGLMALQTAEEVQLWRNSSAKYIEDYHLTKTNDLVILGAILTQQLIIFRAQRKLNGMQAQVDASGVATGAYVMVDLDGEETSRFQKILNTASTEIKAHEKHLGIDKVTREQGGTISIESYIRTVKKAAHDRGIHISKRFIAHEKFANQLRTMLRMFYNLDTEDRAYHDLTEANIMKWCSDQLAEIEELDRKFAHEKGRLYAGKL